MPPPRGTAWVWMWRLKSGRSIIPSCGRSQSISRVDSNDSTQDAQPSSTIESSGRADDSLMIATCMAWNAVILNS